MIEWWTEMGRKFRGLTAGVVCIEPSQIISKLNESEIDGTISAFRKFMNHDKSSYVDEGPFRKTFGERCIIGNSWGNS